MSGWEQSLNFTPLDETPAQEPIMSLPHYQAREVTIAKNKSIIKTSSSVSMIWISQKHFLELLCRIQHPSHVLNSQINEYLKDADASDPHDFSQLKLELCWPFPQFYTEFSSVQAPSRIWITGLPWWLSGKESACQCRKHKFDPWSGKIPHASEQVSHVPQLPSLCSGAQEP